MRILMHVRPDWRELPGGDLVQAQRWAVWLHELGVDVTLSAEPEPDLAGIDLVHLNNLGRSYALWPTLQHCQRFGVPRVLTTLYWPADEYEDHGRPGLRGYLLRVLPVPLRERLKAAWRCLRHAGQRSALLKEIWTGSALPMRQFLTGFQALIANSRAEASELRKLLPDGPRVQVVHSGVDAVYWSAERALWAREERAPLPDGESEPAQGALDHGPATMGKREGVLCIARFDPQKGQHRLIQALRGLDVPLTLAGPDNPNYPSYRALCGRLAGPRVSVLPRVSRAKLKALYHQCRVHALCSWYETTGLTGLEAGCCGARVVMTARGGTHDYGGDRVWYANPSALASMRQAVEQALVASQTPDLLRRVQRHFTWEQSARALVQAYEAVLSESRQLQAA